MILLDGNLGNLGTLLDRIGNVFDNLAIPGEIVDVFSMFSELWAAIPYAVRVALIGCFTFACVLAAIKMLF